MKENDDDDNRFSADTAVTGIIYLYRVLRILYI